MKGISKFFIITILVTVAFLSNLLAADMKMGYIDSDKIMQQYEGVGDAQKDFDEQAKVWETQMKNMQKEIEELRKQYDEKKLLLSEDKKIELETQIQTKMMEYEKFVKDIYGPTGKAAVKNAELLQPIIEKINKIIQRIAADESYDFIFDVVNGNLVFAKEEYDLTARVVEELKKIDEQENN